jgi:hypothetical protein
MSLLVVTGRARAYAVTGVSSTHPCPATAQGLCSAECVYKYNALADESRYQSASTSFAKRFFSLSNFTSTIVPGESIGRSNFNYTYLFPPYLTYYNDTLPR